MNNNNNSYQWKNKKLKIFVFLAFIVAILILIINQFNALYNSTALNREKVKGSISFEEVTEIAGISYVGESFGASWGDFNEDIYPDLWVTNHLQPGTLYINQGNDSFIDSTSKSFSQPSRGDTHGAAWADFDNDGDQDLVQIVGGQGGTGRGSNQMYLNDGEIFSQDQASRLGIDYPLARGRNPLWIDFDTDGLLDLVVTSEKRPDGQGRPTIFRQIDGKFTDSRLFTNFTLSESAFCFLSDLSGDSKLDLICSYPYWDTISRPTIYNVNSTPFTDLSDKLIPDVTSINDIVAADFNGDLLPDLYLTRRKSSHSDVRQPTSNKIKGLFIAARDQKGVQFDATGEVTINLFDWKLPLDEIYIGKSGFHPTKSQFTLSPNASEVEGIFPHEPGKDVGVYIGYNSTRKHWSIVLSSKQWKRVAVNVESSESISHLKSLGFDRDHPPYSDRLLINNGRKLLDKSRKARINSIPTPGQSVVAGDFDNDMDIDVYIVATYTAANQPNILYENLGDATFVAVLEAGGATGSSLGIGESVITADYDVDGFLDLFVTNGEGMPLLHDDGPSQLFHNRGNENHWLEIDLKGSVSNRDGIGAQVLATAGGITQLREQSGGIHRSAQNHQRIHFGLGKNTKADELIIKWPSGIVQKLKNVAADQLIQMTEPSS